MLGNRTWILSFKNKSPVRLRGVVENSPPLPRVKPMRCIPQVPERVFDGADVVDDHNLDIINWSVSDILAIAVGSSVLWDANSGSTSELETADDDSNPVTSVKWAPNGIHTAVAFSNSEVQLWDATAFRLLRTLQGGHGARVSSLEWNNNILTTGSMDSLTINNDVRSRSHVIQTYRGHNQEVCGLKWSASGQQLVSGGNDNLVFTWNLSSNQRVHHFLDHTAAVKALVWSPFQSNLLASGGLAGDDCIKFWNINTGACLNSVDTAHR